VQPTFRANAQTHSGVFPGGAVSKSIIKQEMAPLVLALPILGKHTMRQSGSARKKVSPTT